MPAAILTDWKAADTLFGILLYAWRHKLPPYNGVEPVQGPKVLPKTFEWGGIEHARFLKLSCFWMKGKIDSGTALIQLSRLYENERWMFEPDTFYKLNGNSQVIEDRIKIAMQEHGLGFNVDETSQFWIYNSKKLAKYWDGNPALFYQKAQDYEALCSIFFRTKRTESEHPHGFFGFRHKMVSMLTYFLEDAGIIEAFPYPVPVDFHILRVLVSTGVLYTENMGPGTRLNVDRLSKAARELSIVYCKENNIKTLELADALWNLSREFCRESPSNSSTVSKEYSGRRTPIIIKPIRWTKAENRRALRTCGRCPVAHMCTLAIPSANYYVQGVLVVRGQREKPLDLFAK